MYRDVNHNIYFTSSICKLIIRFICCILTLHVLFSFEYSVNQNVFEKFRHQKSFAFVNNSTFYECYEALSMYIYYFLFISRLRR